MWVYRKIEGGVWTVGYYGPSTAMNDGWTPIRKVSSEDHARAECSYLNGGQTSGPTYIGEKLMDLELRVYQLEENALKGD